MVFEGMLEGGAMGMVTEGGSVAAGMVTEGGAVAAMGTVTKGTEGGSVAAMGTVTEG